MPEDAGKKRKNSAQAMWKSVKKAGAEVSMQYKALAKINAHRKSTPVPYQWTFRCADENKEVCLSCTYPHVL